MSTDGKPEPEKVEPDAPTAAAPTPTEPTQPGPVPYDRFKEVNDQYKAMKSQLDELHKEKEERDKKAKEAAEKQLKEQAKFEELANQYKTELDTTSQTAEQTKEQLERQTAVLESLYESRKGAVPEMYQPLLDKLDLVDRLQWIAENEAKLKPEKNGTPGIPHTPNPKGQGELTPEQRRAKAARTW